MNRKLFLLLLIVLPVTLFCRHPQQCDPAMKVMTYNIRFSNPADGDNYWPNRKGLVLAMIQDQKPDVFGLQEALKTQVKDFEDAFPEYVRVGVGRDDGADSGEFSPVFFNKNRFKAIISGTFWLSTTPDVPGSRGWDAGCNRIVTWVKLTDKLTGRTFCFFNTHFDHIGVEARRNSALLLLNRVDSLAGHSPVIVTGDFNAIPESEPIAILTDNSNPKALTDTRELCNNPEGPHYTYTGFEVTGNPGEQIDYVFVKHISAVVSHKVLTNNTGKYYLSDHLPVVVVF